MNARTYFSNLSSPVIRTIDELSVMADAGLSELYSHCRSCIDRGRSRGQNTREWEEELCYIQREQEIRELRALVHKQWLEEQSQNNHDVPDEDWNINENMTN